MTLLTWDPKYRIEIAEIDRQHEKLFALFNELYEAMQDGHGDEVVGKVLDRVVDYTAYHFAYEEKLFREHGYPGDAAHRAEHAKLTEQTKALAAKRKTGQGDVSIATLKFLSNWLNEHILVSDRNFAPFLIARGVR